MNAVNEDRISELTVAALERMAFLLADPGEFDSAAQAVACRRAKIRYSGPCAGTLVLEANDEFARLLAAGLLGVEPTAVLPATDGQEAIQELANIVGGLLILELGAATRQIYLGLPEPCDAAAEIEAASFGGALPAPAALAARFCIRCDEGSLYVTWLDETGPAGALK